MSIKGCIERIAHSQLSPKEKLNPFFFNENGVMHDDIRKSLLEYIQIYLDHIYLKFENTFIKDISLVGSQASYFYHAGSDIDIAIDFQAEDNKYLKEDCYNGFFKYLANSVCELLPLSGTFKNLKIDVKPFRFEYKYDQQYSLLNNKWVNKFDPNQIKNLDSNKIIGQYYDKLIETVQKIQLILADETSSPKQKNELLKDLHSYTLFNLRNESYLMNIVYRLLRSHSHVDSLGMMTAVNDLNRINKLASSNLDVPKLETPEDTALRLLSPRESLSEFVFHSSGKMHETLRQKIIAAAKIVFEQTAGKLEGVKIKDICLIGSMAGYVYKKNSDIDIAVMVDFSGCPYIELNDDMKSFDYLTEIYASAVHVLPQFKINGKTVDITLKTKFAKQCYSLLQNKWLIEPDKDYFCGIPPQKLAVNFYQELEKYAVFMKQFKTVNSKYTIETCKRFREYIFNKINSEYHNVPDEHIMFTLMAQQGLIKLFNSNMVDSFNYTLSLEGNPD